MFLSAEETHRRYMKEGIIVIIDNGIVVGTKKEVIK